MHGPHECRLQSRLSTPPPNVEIVSSEPRLASEQVKILVHLDMRPAVGEGLNWVRGRAGTYDKQILEWIKDDVVKGDLTQDDANMAELSRRLVRKCVTQRFPPPLPL